MFIENSESAVRMHRLSYNLFSKQLKQILYYSTHSIKNLTKSEWDLTSEHQTLKKIQRMETLASADGEPRACKAGVSLKRTLILPTQVYQTECASSESSMATEEKKSPSGSRITSVRSW